MRIQGGQGSNTNKVGDDNIKRSILRLYLSLVGFGFNIIMFVLYWWT